MRGVEETDKFQEAQKEFKSKFPKNKKCEEVKECKWGVFKEAFFEFSKYRCPICEDKLGSYTSDIDHTRPQSKYEFLECCCQNYMIMCPDCNRGYKRAKFPLEKEFVATDIITIDEEEKLLINPREDDIYEYFELAFINSQTGKKILILKENDKLADNKKCKALETIKLYGLGDCNPKSQTQKCRIELLNDHYLQFYKLAKILDEILADLEDKFDDEQKIDSEFSKKFKIELDKRDNPELLEKYGFLEFLKRGQFVVAV